MSSRKMAGDATKQLAEPIALGLFDLLAEPVGGHPVGLVNHYEVPVGIPEPLLQILVAGKMVEAGNEQVFLGKWVVAVARLDEVAGEDLEAHAELLGKLVLPLGDQPAWSDNKAAG